MQTTDLKEILYDANRQNNINAKYAISHVGHKKWDIISKDIGLDFDLWSHLFEAGRNINADHAPNKTSAFCGEEIYLSIRPELLAAKIVLPEAKIAEKRTAPEDGATDAKKTNHKAKKANEKKAKPLTKAEKIIQQNLADKIKKELDTIIGNKNTEPIHSNRSIIFRCKFIELQIVKLMLQCKNLLQKYDKQFDELFAKSSSKYTPKKEIQSLEDDVKYYKRQITELIVGCNKIIKEKKQNVSISQTCVNDLVCWIDRAKTRTNFNSNEIIVKEPELIFRTIYDGMLEQKQIKLYPSQKEIFNFVTSNQKYLALVHTMLGSGKTTMILPMCAWLLSNKKNGMKSNILFCCPNEVVLLEVAHMVFGMAVPFAIVIYDQKEKKLQYKYSSFADDTNPDSAILYLCDIFVAKLLLEQRQKCIVEKKLYFDASRNDPHNYPLIENRIPVVPDYILVGDELTKDADSQIGFAVNSGFSLTTEVFVGLMKIAPPKVILFSSTLPTAEQLPEFYKSIIDANPEMVMKSFSASEARIGCALISHDGELYAPHMGCKNSEEIRHILEVIKTNPFVGRFYTFEVLLQMVEAFKELGLQVPDLSVMFDDPSKASQTNIQQTAYSMLETLISTNSDEMITNTCKMKKTVDRGVNLSTIFTTDIPRFSKGCLIFSSDPLSTAFDVYRANFDKFLDDSERNIFQQIRLDNILTKYQREMELFNKAKKRVDEKKDDGIIKRNKEADKKDKAKMESWQISSNMSEDRPNWDFPPVLQLCSPEHLNKVKCSGLAVLGGMISPEDLPTDTVVSMDILTMLASGIGVYTTENDALDDSYLKAVIYLAKKGLVKTIFTDSSIAYGTNLAVSDIIMIDEPIVRNNNTIIESIVDRHSMKTLFQMLARAGRGGNLSFEARIYTTDRENKLINKIISYSKGVLDEGSRDEIFNIGNAYKVLW